MSHDVLEIGLFQLENLAATPTRFLFFDLRKKAEPISPGIDRLLAKAKRIPVDQIAANIQASGADVHTPVVLICENGKQARKAGAKLAKVGHTNVCVVEGGTLALRREEEGTH